MAGMGALTGSFWGLLYGLLFFVPLLGMAVGAAFGAPGGSLTDVGIATSLFERSGMKCPWVVGAAPDDLAGR